MKKLQLAFWLVSKVLQRGIKNISHFFKRQPASEIPRYQKPLLPHKTSASSGNLSFLLALMFISFLASIALAIYPKIKNDYTISEGLVGVYTKDNLPLAVTSLISEPLVIFDEKSVPQPNLIESWEPNENLTEYKITLKDGLYWHDGTKLIASDLKINIPDVEVSYVDDKTINFKLADSFAPFPTLLTEPIFKNNTLVGLGKYRLLNTSTDDEIITKISLAPKNKSDGLPNLVLRFYQDEATAKTAFELGEITSLIGLNDTSFLEEQSPYQIKKIVNVKKIVAIFFNLKDPILADDNLRKALHYASPKIENEMRAITSIQPNSWAFNSDIKDNLDNFAEAEKYMAKVNIGEEQVLTLTTTPSLEKLGEQIVYNWKKLGLNVVLRVESGVPQSFQALLISESIPLDPDQYSLWHSTQTKTNISDHTFAPRIDKDLEDGRKEKDFEKRTSSYKDFQKILLDVNPAIFFYFPKTTVVYRDKAEDGMNKVLPLQFNYL